VGEREGEREIWGEGAAGPARPKRGRAGAAGPARGGWAGRGRPTARERGKGRREREEKKKKKKVFSFLKSFFSRLMDPCFQTIKRMHGSAWCIKQNKIL
jgi:hypothetical protein